MIDVIIVFAIIALLLTAVRMAYIAFCTICLPNNHPRNIAIKQRLNPHVKYRRI